MTDTAAPTPAGKPRARRLGLLILAAVVLVVGIVWAVFHFLLAAPAT